TINDDQVAEVIERTLLRRRRTRRTGRSARWLRKLAFPTPRSSKADILDVQPVRPLFEESNPFAVATARVEPGHLRIPGSSYDDVGLSRSQRTHMSVLVAFLHRPSETQRRTSRSAPIRR